MKTEDLKNLGISEIVILKILENKKMKAKDILASFVEFEKSERTFYRALKNLKDKEKIGAYNKLYYVI